MRIEPRTLTWLMLAVVAITWGCGGMKVTKFTNPDYNFAFVETVAVLPLENLSSDRQAGERTTRLMITELLASGAVDVVEPGEVQAALTRVAGGSRTPDAEQIIALGEALQVQAVILGSVQQSNTVRAGGTEVPVVTLDVHMLETESGSVVWGATHTEKGSTTSAKVFGTGSEPISKVTRECVRKIVNSLVG